MRPLIKSFVILAFALLAASPALAQRGQNADIINAVDIDEIMNIARGFGSASLSKDSQGDPLIRGKVNGLGYSIYFYDCTNGEKCKSIQFTSGFNFKNSNIKKMNDWNLKKRWVKARIDDEGDPVISMDIPMRHGIPRQSLESALSTWTDLMAEFATFIGFKT